MCGGREHNDRTSWDNVGHGDDGFYGYGREGRKNTADGERHATRGEVGAVAGNEEYVGVILRCWSLYDVADITCSLLHPQPT